jgi:hypothetical protein
MSVTCDGRVLLGRDLCARLITRLEKSYRVCECVCVCVCECVRVNVSVCV